MGLCKVVGSLAQVDPGHRRIAHAERADDVFVGVGWMSLGWPGIGHRNRDDRRHRRPVFSVDGHIVVRVGDGVIRVRLSVPRLSVGI